MFSISNNSDKHISNAIAQMKQGEAEIKLKYTQPQGQQLQQSLNGGGQQQGQLA